LIKIGRKDIFWNYGATFLKISSSALLIPFILKMMPSEMVGIWTVFMTISSFSGLLDLGFNLSFTRNITYIFSGVRSLKITGVESVSTDNQSVDYDLLKGVIQAMRWFYLRMAIVLFILLGTLGSYYIFNLLQGYTGNHLEVYISWALFCLINAYNLFTLYFDSLLQGRGLVKKSKQIVIIGQSAYLIIAASLILVGYGLIAIISAQAFSVIIIRYLSYKSFFTPELKQLIYSAVPRSKKEIIKTIYPNALKIGLTSLGGFMVQRSAIIIGSLYLSLKEIASYGITMQLIGVITGLAGIYIATYQPRIMQYRVENNDTGIKRLYLNGQIIIFLTYIIGGIILLFFGEWAINSIGSQTHLIPQLLFLVAIMISFLENNHSVAGTILLSKNEVPFFKASLIAGGVTIVLLFILFQFAKMDLWPMILAPGIAHLYNNWKWPYEVFKQLNISIKDVSKSIMDFPKNLKNEK
jgi:O-antigen/teichoic acid export membrane protein